MPLLHNRDPFPRLSIAKVGGGTLNLPEDLKGSFGEIFPIVSRASLTATRNSPRSKPAERQAR